MPHSYGYRARTRDLFARDFRRHGIEHLSTYLQTYRIGDLVDIKGNGAIQKGMPHKFYHGRTGVVFNVAKAAVGIIIHKRVRHRFLEKRINVRIEHIKHSKCRQDFLERLKVKAASKVSLKRFPALPRSSHVVDLSKTSIEEIAPVPYEILI